MIQLVGVYVLVLVAMASRDALGTVATACIVHERKVLAGVFDGLCDIGNVVSITVTGAVTLEHGLTPATFAAFAALFAGSMLGTYSGITGSQALERVFGKPVPTKGVPA